MDPILIGVDLGTTSCKAAAYDQRGTRLGEESTSLSVIRPKVGWAEQEGEKYWHAFRTAFIRLTSDLSNNQAISGIAISGQSPTLIILDQTETPIRKAIIWMDSRAAGQATQIAEKTGLYRPPTYNSPKILWLRQNEPKSYQQIRWIQSPSGFVSSRLVGKQVVDLTDNEFYDFTKKKWNTPFLEQLNIPLQWLPQPIRTGDTMGLTTSKMSHELGIPENTPIIAAPFDGMASLHGVGVINPGQCAIVLGTSTGVGAVSTTAPPRSSKLFVARHFHKWDWWLIGGVMSMGGAAFDWFQEQIWNFNSPIASSRELYQEIENEVEKIKAGSGGLIFLPYLTGERSPIWDNAARGTYFGLSTMHTQAHLLRALMEGVGFGIQHNIDVMNEYDIHASEYIVTGGIGRSVIWTQIFADIIGRPIRIPRYLDSETLGDAMLVAVNQGLYRSHEEATKSMVQIIRTVKPIKANHTLYSDLYPLYRELYNQLKDLFVKRLEIVNKHQLEEERSPSTRH
jgi:xylulokinase